MNVNELSDDFGLMMLADELEHNIRKIQGRCLFFYAKDIILPLQEQEILDQFQRAQESVVRFKSDLNRISGLLYQRKAQIGSIAKDHLAWKAELEVNADKQAWLSCREYYKYVPLLKDPKKVAIAFRYMVRLETLTRPLSQKYEELIKVLESPLHHNALEFYKKHKRACKEIKARNVSAENKIDRLVCVFREVKTRIEEATKQFHGKERCVVEQSTLLYEELLKFIKYAVGTFQVQVESNDEPPVLSSDSDSLGEAYGHLSFPVSNPVTLNQIEEVEVIEEYDRGSQPVGYSTPPLQTKYSRPGYQMALVTPEATPEPSQDSEDREPNALRTYGSSRGRDTLYTQPMFGYSQEHYAEDERSISPKPQNQQAWFSSWNPLGSLFGSGSSDDLLRDSASDSAVIKYRIDELIKNIERTEQQLIGFLPLRQQQGVVSQELEERIRGYVGTASNFRLHSEDDFRNGQMFTTQSGIGRYLSIKDQVNNLRQIAQALAMLLSTIEERIADLCGANSQPAPGFTSLEMEKDFYEALIGNLEQLISQQKAELARLPISGRVHAGWYYAAKLLSNVREVNRYMGLFKTLVREDFLNFTAASNWLIEYLDPTNSYLAHDASYFTGARAITRLYASIQGHHQLLKPKSIRSFSSKLRTLIYTTIEEIIAKKGPCTLQLTEEEKLVPGCIFQKVPLDSLRTVDENQDAILPEVLRRYLMKGFLNHLFFSATPADPEFEVVLNMLQEPLGYGEVFEATIKHNQEFSRYFSAYRLHTDMFENTHHIRLMGKILYVLAQNEGTNELNTLLGYCQARQMLSALHSEAVATQSTQMPVRLNWIRRQSEVILKRMEGSLPQYFSKFESIEYIGSIQCDLDPVFYKLVTRSLYAKDEDERSEADSFVVQLLAKLPPEDLPKDPTIRTLLTVWSLEHILIEPLVVIPHRDLFLSKFFIKYLSDNDVRALWREKYGLGVMEIALYMLVTFKEAQRAGFHSPVCQKICTTRQMMDYVFWKQVIGEYEQFRAIFMASKDNKVGSHTYIQADECIQRVLEIFDVFPTDVERDDDSTHVGISRWCLRDMREKFNARYVYK